PKEAGGHPRQSAPLAHHLLDKTMDDVLGGYLDVSAAPDHVVGDVGLVRRAKVIRDRATESVEFNAVANEPAIGQALHVVIDRQALRVDQLQRETPRPGVPPGDNANDEFTVSCGGGNGHALDLPQRVPTGDVAVLRV